MKTATKLGIIFLALTLLALPLLAACGGDDEEEEPTKTPTATATSKPTPKPTGEPGEKVTLTIGQISDLTGAASVAMVVVNNILDDIVEWSNEQNFIPGVELKVLNYDGQYDPSKDVPGYIWLKDKGSDIFLTGLPNPPVSLETRVNDEKTVLICMNMDDPQAVPPGYLFSINMGTADIVRVFLKWIADNDWDWKTKGPAEIGLVAWDTTYYRAQEAAAKEYIDAHPEQFKWKGAHLITSGFKWDTQVENTKDFDYIMPPGAPLVSFIKQYYDAGGKARLIMCDTHISFFGLIGDAKLWPDVNGALVFLPSPMWNEDAEIVNLAKDLLVKRGGQTALNKAMQREHGYLTSAHQFYGMLLMIKQTVERVGAENFSQQALYDTLTSGFVADFGEAYAPWGYDPSTDRFGFDNQMAYRIDGTTGNLVRADREWWPAPAK